MEGHICMFGISHIWKPLLILPVLCWHYCWSVSVRELDTNARDLPSCLSAPLGLCPHHQPESLMSLVDQSKWKIFLYLLYLVFPKGTVVNVVKSRRKWQREIDSWISFRKLPSLQCTPHTRDNDRIPILCVRRLRWISQVSFRAYWFERSLTLSPSLFLLSRSLPLSPSFRLSLSPSGSRLPSFLPSFRCNMFVGRRTQNKSSLFPFSIKMVGTRPWGFGGMGKEGSCYSICSKGT